MIMNINNSTEITEDEAMNNFLRNTGQDFVYPKQWQDGTIPTFPYGKSLID